MIVVVFATRREAQPLLKLLGAQPLGAEDAPNASGTGQAAPLRPTVWSSGQGLIMTVGVGKAKTQERLCALLSQHAADAVINVGICGAASDGVEVGTLFEVSQVRDGDQRSAQPLAAPVRRTSLDQARLTTVETAVFGGPRRVEIGQWGELVDMEGYAVARLCCQRAIPWTPIKGVSDLADDQGETRLLENIDSVSAKLACCVAETVL